MLLTSRHEEAQNGERPSISFKALKEIVTRVVIIGYEMGSSLVAVNKKAIGGRLAVSVAS